MEVALSDTIIVRRLPEVLTDADLNDLFSSFGALHAFREKPAGKMKRSSVIVKYEWCCVFCLMIYFIIMLSIHLNSTDFRHMKMHHMPCTGCTSFWWLVSGL